MADRRFGERFAADGTLGFLAESVESGSAGGRCVSGKVVNLSGSGALVRCRGLPPRTGSLLVAQLAFRRRLTRQTSARLVRVMPSRSRSDVAELAVCFEEGASEALADVAEVVTAVAPAPPSLAEVLAVPQSARSDLIPLDVPAFVRVVLRGAGREFRILPREGEDGPSTRLLVRVTQGDGATVLAGFPVAGTSPRPAPGPGLRMLVASGRRSLVIVHAVVARREPPYQLFPVSAWLFRRRSGDRIRLPAGWMPEMHCPHPLLRPRVVVRPVRDLGEGGFSFDGDLRADILAPGMLLPDVRLRIAGQDVVRLTGTVRSVRPLGYGRHRFGVRVESSDPVGAWDAFVLRLLMPHVRPLAQDDAPQVWELLGRTGYLDEKPRELIAPLEHDFGRSWGRLVQDPALGRGLLLHDAKSLRGAVFQTQAFPGTYILHQLALDLHSPVCDVPKPVIAGQIYRSLFHLCARAPNLRFTIAVFNDEKAWSGHLYDEFFALAGDRGVYSVERLRLVEKRLPLGDAAAAAPAGGRHEALPSVRPFAEADREAVEAGIRRAIPALAADALALLPLDPDLAALGEAYRAAGLRRGRETLVAERDDLLLGAVVADYASPGINIFGLLDTVTPVRLAAEDGAWDWLHGLLAEVERRRAGTADSVLLALPAEWPADAVPPEYQVVAVVRRWVAHRSLLPAYLAYLDEHFGIDGPEGGGES